MGDGDLFKSIIITIPIMVLIVIFFKNNIKTKYKPLFIIGLFIFTLFILAIFSITGISPMSGFHTDIRLKEISLIPFNESIGMILDIPNLMKTEHISIGIAILCVCLNIIGNILLFCPIGFFLPLLWNDFRKFSKTVIFGFLVSLIIECSQLFLIRTTDIDDLIFNTLGTMIGYLFFKVFKKLFPTFSEKFTLQYSIQSKTNSKLLPILCFIVPYLIIVSLGFYQRSILISNIGK